MIAINFSNNQKEMLITSGSARCISENAMKTKKLNLGILAAIMICIILASCGDSYDDYSDPDDSQYSYDREESDNEYHDEDDWYDTDTEDDYNWHDTDTEDDNNWYDTDTDNNYNSYNTGIERDYDWYINQIGSGADEYINCGPACAVMAAKWSDRNFNETVLDARNSFPDVLNQWWFYRHIRDYLEYNDVSITYSYSFNLNDAISYLDNGRIIIANIRAGDISYGDDNSGTGRFYSYDEGHFIILKGYYTIDGNTYFEVYDPFTINEYYGDGSPKGRDRLYPANEVVSSVSSWGDGEYIVVNP